MPQPTETPEVKFTQSQLLDLIKELRKPADLTEDQKAQKEAEIQGRKELATLVHERAKLKKLEQDMCTHMRRNNTPLGVYVENGNFIICQGCQKIIRPEEDVNLFNRLFVTCQNQADIF